MHYKIKELHKIITIIANEEGLSEHGQTLLEGYAIGLETELASNTKIIGSVSNQKELLIGLLTKLENGRGSKFIDKEQTVSDYLKDNL